MIAIPYSPHYSDNLSRKTDKDALPCAVCGKAVSRPRYWVHVHLGGSHIVTEEEAAELDTAADVLTPGQVSSWKITFLHAPDGAVASVRLQAQASEE
jgi:hypothetical protein